MKKIFFILFMLLQFSLFAKGQRENLSGEYFEIANAYEELKNYEKAIYFYKKASTDEAYKNAAQYNLARTYALQHDWNASSKLLKDLNAHDPENQLICSAYAYTLVALGNVEEAKKLYSKIAKSNNDDPERVLDYIRLLVFAKDYENAKSEIDNAILNFPSAKEREEFEKIKKQIETEASDNKKNNEAEN